MKYYSSKYILNDVKQYFMNQNIYMWPQIIIPNNKYWEIQYFIIDKYSILIIWKLIMIRFMIHHIFS